MADFREIKDEFKLIAEAQTGIGSFEYGRKFELNAYRNNAVPLFLLFKQPTISPLNRTRNKKIYSVQFGIYTTYTEAERKANVDYEDKQADLENLADQFLRELYKRSVGMTAESTSTKDWIVGEDISGIFQEQVGVDGLVGLEITLPMEVFSDCDEGTFNY